MLIPQAILLSMALFVFDTPAVAGTSLAPVQFAQVYTDLPGVKTQQEAEAANRVTCEQVLVQRNTSKIDPTYDTINSCRRGDGPAFQSSRLPPSNERQLRGLNY